MSKQDNDSNIEIFVISLIIVLGLLALTYHYFYQEILGAWKYIRIAESYAFSWMSYILPASVSPQFLDIASFLKETDYSDLTRETVQLVDSHIKPYIGTACGIIVFYIGWRMDKKTCLSTTRHNINSLLKDRSHVYEHLQEYADFDPNKELVEFDRNDSHAKRHAPPLMPDEYCLMVPPIGLESMAKRRSDYRTSIWNKRDRFDIDLMKESLTSQLGPLFTTIDDIRDEYSTCFKYISSKIIISREEVYKITLDIFAKVKKDNVKSHSMTPCESKIAQHLTDKKGDFKYSLDKKSIRSIYKKMTKDPVLKELIILRKSESCMLNHAFISTGLVALMSEAASRNNFSLNTIRNDIKERNRSLYFALNCVGRSGSFIECCGIISHYTYEVDTGSPAPQPQVDLAIIGVQDELNILQ